MNNIIIIDKWRYIRINKPILEIIHSIIINNPLALNHLSIIVLLAYVVIQFILLSSIVKKSYIAAIQRRYA